MRRLSFIDDIFLRMETRKTPLHVGVLILFRPPEGAAESFVSDLYQKLGTYIQAAEPFNWLLVQKRGLHYWKEDDDFDLGNHLVHTVLPKPGRIRELLALVSRLHCSHLDRMYPLWRLHLIEGLEDGRFAVYLKIHHAIADGVAITRMLSEAMSADIDVSRNMPAIWSVPSEKSGPQPGPVPSAGIGALASLRSLAKEGVSSLKSPIALLRELRSTYRDYRENRSDVAIGLAPNCVLSKPVSSTRRFAAQSYSRPRIKSIATAFGATSNDVILTMCASAIRRYLIELNDLPDRPIIAAVPVSTREKNEGFGNEVAFTAVNLATNIDDPGERLRAIQRGMNINKKHLNALSPAQKGAYSSLMIMPGLLNAVVGVVPDCGVSAVVVSHVPGPQQDMYWQGAKLEGVYPMSLVMDGSALNFTMMSRHDMVDFGIIASHKTIPHTQRLLQYLEDSLVELEASIDHSSKH